MRLHLLFHFYLNCYDWIIGIGPTECEVTHQQMIFMLDQLGPSSSSEDDIIFLFYVVTFDGFCFVWILLTCIFRLVDVTDE